MADDGDLDDDSGIFDYEDDDEDDDDTVGGELADEELDSEELMAEVERFLRDQGPDEK